MGCDPGLLLAYDGRCAGSTAPWALQTSGWTTSARQLQDGSLLFQDLGSDYDNPVVTIP